MVRHTFLTHIPSSDSPSQEHDETEGSHNLGGARRANAATPFMKSYQDVDPCADAAALHAQNAAASTRYAQTANMAVPFVKFYDEHLNRPTNSGGAGVTGLLGDSPTTSRQASAPESDLSASEVTEFTMPLGLNSRNQMRDDEGGNQRIHEVLRAIVERMDAIDRPPAYASGT